MRILPRTAALVGAATCMEAIGLRTSSAFATWGARPEACRRRASGPGVAW